MAPRDPSQLPKDKQEKAAEILRRIKALKQADPIQAFHACPRYCGSPDCHKPSPSNPAGGHPHQFEFGAARTRIQAAFAGNRFGKTTILVAKCFIQHYPYEELPDRLKPFRVVEHDLPVKGRLMCPSDDAFEEYMWPKLKSLAPRHLLIGDSIEKAWSKQFRVLHFKDGGQLKVFTYKQDVGVLVGGDYDYVGYDEPPPREHRSENVRGLTDRGGFEMYAMTPVNQGAGIGWIYRDIYKKWQKGEDPNITVVKGSGYDNPTLTRENVDWVLSQYDEKERAARERGDFVHMGGMVYDGGFEDVLCDPATPEHVAAWDVIVGIDPGLKNAAFIWVGFDSENTAFVFDEVRLREKTTEEYAAAIDRVNQKWGLSRDRCTFVIDPSARNRSLVNAESVEANLARTGIYCIHGYNPIEAGVQQIRGRMKAGRFFVCRNGIGRCTELRDEADEYRMKDRPDGEFEAIDENNHSLDATRYAVTHRPWNPQQDLDPQPPVRWRPGTAPPLDWFNDSQHPDEAAPLGFMS